MNAADESARINRLRQLEERRQLAEVAGVQIPVMPPRLPGESDKDYGCRIAWIAKANCGPPPRKKLPPKPLALSNQAAKINMAPGEDRLANMTHDPDEDEF